MQSFGDILFTPAVAEAENVDLRDRFIALGG
jgi:hypothetical protein